MNVRPFIALTLYRLLFICLLPAVILILVIRSRNNPQYRHRIKERLGYLPKKMTRGGIVIHAASVGEVLALKPFVQQLIDQQPALNITFTTFTPTGSAQVTKLFGDKVQHCYIPIDSWPCTWLFLKKLKPKAMVFMETEIWPNLISQCASKNIKLLLINGRLSQNSVEKYQKLRWLIASALKKFDYIYCQSQENLNNFLILGAADDKTAVSGNLKFDIAINTQLNDKKAELAQYLPGNRKVWVVASTHPGDEELILDAFTLIRMQFPELLLVLVPRHPERFEQIASLCQLTFNTVRRSEQHAVTKENDVWLLDSLGELLATFALADVVTMGGSFSHIGGHNPLEPALFKLPIVVGHDMSNFNEVMAQLQHSEGIIQLNDKDNIVKQLSEVVIDILAQSPQYSSLGENAYQVVQANQGASNRSVEKLLSLLNS